MNDVRKSKQYETSIEPCAELKIYLDTKYNIKQLERGIFELLLDL